MRRSRLRGLVFFVLFTALAVLGFARKPLPAMAAVQPTALGAASLIVTGTVNVEHAEEGLALVGPFVQPSAPPLEWRSETPCSASVSDAEPTSPEPSSEDDVEDDSEEDRERLQELSEEIAGGVVSEPSWKFGATSRLVAASTCALPVSQADIARPEPPPKLAA